MSTLHYEKDEVYYIYNKGVSKLFLDKQDYARFLFLILYLQSPLTLFNISRNIQNHEKTGRFGLSKDKRDEIIKTREVELMGYCLLKDSFYLMIKNTTKTGIPTYMQKVQNAYGKFFNIKHSKKGHVFRGVYERTLIESDDSLIHVSAYIHKAPLGTTRNDLIDYPWSSLKHYALRNKWGRFLNTEAVLSHFPSKEAYERYVETSLPRSDVKEMLELNE